jgi:hypothetical protein
MVISMVTISMILSKNISSFCRKLVWLLYSTVPLNHAAGKIVILTCIKTDLSFNINFFQYYQRDMDGMGRQL